MGAAKEAALMHQERVGAAAEFLVSIGTLERCEAHGDTYEGDGDLEAAYRIAASRHRRGELGFADGLTQREATDLVKAAFEDNGMIGYCPRCAKIDAE